MLTTACPSPLARKPKPPSPPNRLAMPPHWVSICTPYELAIQLPRRRKNGWLGVTSIDTVSPGSTPATSTQPPCGGAVYVVTKNDPPPSTLRFSPANRPPSVLASSWTPALCAIIAPPSTRIGSPPASRQRATVKDGSCRSCTCMAASCHRRHVTDAMATRTRRTGDRRVHPGRASHWVLVAAESRAAHRRPLRRPRGVRAAGEASLREPG